MHNYLWISCLSCYEVFYICKTQEKIQTFLKSLSGNLQAVWKKRLIHLKQKQLRIWGKKCGYWQNISLANQLIIGAFRNISVISYSLLPEQLKRVIFKNMAIVVSPLQQCHQLKKNKYSLCPVSLRCFDSLESCHFKQSSTFLLILTELW